MRGWGKKKLLQKAGKDTIMSRSMPIASVYAPTAGAREQEVSEPARSPSRDNETLLRAFRRISLRPVFAWTPVVLFLMLWGAISSLPSPIAKSVLGTLNLFRF
jgi:hypothetical protein